MTLGLEWSEGEFENRFALLPELALPRIPSNSG